MNIKFRRINRPPFFEAAVKWPAAASVWRKYFPRKRRVVKRSRPLPSVASSRRQMVLGALYMLLILGSIFRVGYVWNNNPLDNIFSDPQRHWEQGAEPLRNDPLVMTDPIMYQVYVGALAKLSAQIPGLVAFYTALLSLLMPWVWYRFFRELQPSKLAAVAGWTAITWLPSWTGIYSYFMQETLMLPLLGAALYLTWYCKRKQTCSSFLWMVLFWTLAGLTRSVCIPLAVVATAWVWWQHGDKFRRAAYATVILALFLGPLTYRSLDFMGIAAPTGVAQMNLIYGMSGKQEVKIHYDRGNGVGWEYGFMSPALLVEPLEPLSRWRTQREGTVWIRIDMNRGSADWNRALRENFPTLERYLWIVKDNLILLFFSDSWPDSNREFVLGEINYQLRWMWVPLAVVCLLLTLVYWRRARRHFLLPALILTWFVVQGLVPAVPNEGRYRKPVEGLLIAQMVLLIGGIGQGEPRTAVVRSVAPRRTRAVVPSPRRRAKKRRR